MLNPITRRLLPLYIASFFQGLILWYAIEKVYMASIGFNASTIALMVIVMSAALLIVEIPAGVLADRWSRKNVLMLSSVLLFSSTLLLGLSTNVGQYLVAVTLYGMQMGTYSGLSEAITYDSLVEMHGSRAGYEKYSGYCRAFGSIGLVVGSLLGGLVANKFGLRAAYMLSLPSAALAFLAALKVKEPSEHRSNKTTYLLAHTRETFAHIFRRGIVLWIVITAVAVGIVSLFLLEVDQLWPLTLKMPVIWYGPLNALLLLGYGLGALVASFVAKKRLVGVMVCLIGLSAVISLSVHNMPVIALAQFSIIGCFSGLMIVADGKLQDTLPSNLRTGALSILSSLTTVCFLPLAFLFGRIATSFSVFRASYLLIPLTLVGVTGYLIISRSGKIKHPSRAPSLVSEELKI